MSSNRWTIHDVTWVQLQKKIDPPKINESEPENDGLVQMIEPSSMDVFSGEPYKSSGVYGHCY